MAEESSTTTYFIPERFEAAVRSVRRTLVDAGLKISGELDLAGRLQRRLQVNTPPCKVLFVSPEMIRWSAAGTAALTPLHVVVSARGPNSEIHVLRVPTQIEGAEESLVQLGTFRVQISQAIERIAMRTLLGV